VTQRQRIVVVTGATDGIGKRTAIEIAKRGPDLKVFVHGRSEAKAEAAAREVEAAADAKGRIEPCAADFASLASVRRLGETLCERLPVIDVLVNNAGVVMDERVMTEDGFETTFHVNHLAPFLLTLTVLPSLRASAHGRTVHVSSVAHRSGRLRAQDLSLGSLKSSKGAFDGYVAYATSKLCNVLFSNELARRLVGTSVTSNSLHPGVITTKLLWKGFRSRGADLGRGAATSVKLALDPAFDGVIGRYFDDEREAATVAAASDPSLMAALWSVSIDATHAPPL